MTETTLHPLEVMALQELPWEFRVKRIASLYIHGSFGSMSCCPNAKDIREVVKKVGEPWGKKMRLTDELAKEIAHQQSIRSTRRHRRSTEFHCCDLDEYDPVRAIQSEWNVKTRRESLARVRIGKSYRPLDRRVRWNFNYLPCGDILDARVRKGEALIVVKPSSVHNGHSYVYDDDYHRVRYLLFKVGDVGGNVRISIKAKTIEDAINSLKRSTVVAAEKKNYEVEIDWAEKCFKVRAPSRKKWRSIPFKESCRKRRR